MAAVDEYMTCAICFDWFKSPRRLPCLHVYCLECLRGIVKPDTDCITCPECRRDYAILNKKVEEFQIDGRLEQLIEKQTKLKVELDETCKHDPALIECDHGQTAACRECQTHNRAILLESLLQESRRFQNDFLTDNQMTTRQKHKSDLLLYKENLEKFKIEVFMEIAYMIEQLEKRNLTLLSKIETEEKLIVDYLSKLDQAEATCAQQSTLMADLVYKVSPTKALVSLRVQLSEQRELMTSLRNIGRNKRIINTKFNREKLRDMIDTFGDFVTAVDYQKDDKSFITLDGSEGGLVFKQPWGLTVCPFTDHIYVTDHTSIRVYDSEGKHIRHVVTNNCPNGLAVDSNQRLIVTTGIERSVKIYNRDLKLVRSFGSIGDKNGQFRWPQGVVCDTNDNIFVVDRDNPRVQVFSADGIFMFVIGINILQRPRFVQINKRQELLVTDHKLGQIVIFNKDGKHLNSITGAGDKKIKVPAGICLDTNDRILVADHENKMIQVFNQDGTHHSTITEPATAMTSMFGLAVTTSGLLFITDFCGNKIHRIATDKSTGASLGLYWQDG